LISLGLFFGALQGGLGPFFAAELRFAAGYFQGTNFLSK
jgi:hypothetical protein